MQENSERFITAQPVRVDSRLRARHSPTIATSRNFELIQSDILSPGAETESSKFDTPRLKKSKFDPKFESNHYEVENNEPEVKSKRLKLKRSKLKIL